MRIIRFLSGGSIYTGRQVDARTAHVINGDICGPHHVSEHARPVEKYLAPIVPTDILCIGVNYRQHAIETAIEMPDHPMLFIKSGNTLNNPVDPIPLPRLSSQIDYEGELAIIISKPAKNVPRQHALEYVLGYTVANDVTARDWQRDKKLGGGQFARGKSFDGFCPIGPCIVTRDEIPNPNDLMLRTKLNGELKQESSTGDMIFDVPTLIESLSSTMTLRAGAIILTGTPSGVGWARKPQVFLKDGDEVSISIDIIGTLTNSVASE